MKGVGSRVRPLRRPCAKDVPRYDDSRRFSVRAPSSPGLHSGRHLHVSSLHDDPDVHGSANGHGTVHETVHVGTILPDVGRLRSRDPGGVQCLGFVTETALVSTVGLSRHLRCGHCRVLASANAAYHWKVREHRAVALAGARRRHRTVHCAVGAAVLRLHTEVVVIPAQVQQEVVR